MSVLDKLPTLKTSDEFISAIEEAHKEAGAAHAEIQNLEEELRAACFDPKKGKLEDIRRHIGKAKEARELILGIIDELEVRREQALEVETDNEVQRRIAEARTARERLRAAYLKIHELALSFREELKEVERQSETIRLANLYASDHGRRDLTVEQPLCMLKALVGHSGMSFPAPGSVLIPGYYPHLHPDGTFLQRLKELKL